MSVVWYVAYGSNLLAVRFRCYLEGGRAPGGRRSNPGARDPAAWTGDRRVDLRHPLLFGGPSQTWHGGPAFLDVERSGHSLGRAWRVTVEQLEDVLAQENGRAVGAVTIDDADLSRGGRVGVGRYSRLVALDDIDGTPAVTLTYHRRPVPRAPDPAYVALIGRGLREIGLTPAQARAALRRQPQLSDRGVRLALTAA